MSDNEIQTHKHDALVVEMIAVAAAIADLEAQLERKRAEAERIHEDYAPGVGAVLFDSLLRGERAVRAICDGRPYVHRWWFGETAARDRLAPHVHVMFGPADEGPDADLPEPPSLDDVVGGQ